ncbi:single-stranded DNA-binding protein, partial [Mycoplasmopsis pullorum]
NKPSYQANTYSDLNQSVNLSIEEKDISSSAVFSRAETEEDDDSISANDFENITDDLNDDIDLDKGF